MFSFKLFIEAMGQMNYATAMKIFGLQAGQVLDTQKLKSIYRSLSFRYHPDSGGSNEAFSELGAAYSYLQHFIGKPLPTLSTAYETPPATPTGPAAAQPQSSYGTDPWHAIHDLFSQMQDAFDNIEVEMRKRSKNWPVISNLMASVISMDPQGFMSRDTLLMRLKDAIKAMLPPNEYNSWFMNQSNFMIRLKEFITSKDNNSFKYMKAGFQDLYDKTMMFKKAA